MIISDKVPMDDYYENVGGVLNLKNKTSDYLNGVDFFINYIGNKDYSFYADYFELTIWENGEDGGGDYLASKVTKPTCTARGYTTYTCACCGYSYKDNYVNAKGHSYTSVVTPPTTKEQGYTTHTCTACGDSYTDSYTGTLCIIGDVNDDGEITAVDAAMACAIVNGRLDANETQLLAADVNGDGEITAVDAAMIYSYFNGKLAAFPI